MHPFGTLEGATGLEWKELRRPRHWAYACIAYQAYNSKDWIADGLRRQWKWKESLGGLHRKQRLSKHCSSCSVWELQCCQACQAVTHEHLRLSDVFVQSKVVY